MKTKKSGGKRAPKGSRKPCMACVADKCGLTPGDATAGALALASMGGGLGAIAALCKVHKMVGQFIVRGLADGVQK